MLEIVFIAQIIIGLLIYGRGWWHMAFAAGTESEPNEKQLFVPIGNYTVNLTAIANGLLGLALIASGIYGLVAL